MKKEIKTETPLEKYNRLFEAWKFARDRANDLHRQWQEAAKEVITTAK